MLYRLYTISNRHVIDPPRIIQADNDAAAVEQAKRYMDGQDLELWHEAHLVARLDAPKSDDRTNDPGA